MLMTHSGFVPGRGLLFIVTVLLPTLFSIAYFGFIASDVYISEMQITVRSQQKQSSTALGGIMQNIGVTPSSQDAYLVRDFMMSRDALKAVDEGGAYRAAVSNTAIDLLSRFNSFGIFDGFEDLFKYYKDHVKVAVNAQSSVVRVTVRAYAPDEALQVNERLTRESEKLVNILNERARKDMLAFAEGEVNRAMVRAQKASEAVSAYRDDTIVFDPEQQSALHLQLVSKIQDEIIATRTQLAQIKVLAPSNPQIPAMRQKIKSLEEQEKLEIAKVVGNAESFSSKSSAYEALILEREFAQKQLAAAMASLEEAHDSAKRKQMYLETIEAPGLPDTAMEPRRLRAIMAAFMIGLILWGVLSILIAGVREHHE